MERAQPKPKLKPLRTAARAVARRPDLWPAAAVEGLRMVPRRWWRRWPPGPQPDAGYLSFRVETFYGDGTHGLEPADVVSWLEWCRRLRRLAH